MLKTLFVRFPSSLQSARDPPGSWPWLNRLPLQSPLQLVGESGREAGLLVPSCRFRRLASRSLGGNVCRAAGGGSADSGTTLENWPDGGSEPQFDEGFYFLYPTKTKPMSTPIPVMSETTIPTMKIAKLLI